MSDQPRDADDQEEDRFSREVASPLPDREAMSIIDPSGTIRIPYLPPDPATDGPSTIPDDRYEQ